MGALSLRAPLGKRHDMPDRQQLRYLPLSSLRDNASAHCLRINHYLFKRCLSTERKRSVTSIDARTSFGVNGGDVACSDNEDHGGGVTCEMSFVMLVWWDNKRNDQCFGYAAIACLQQPDQPLPRTATPSITAPPFK